MVLGKQTVIMEYFTYCAILYNTVKSDIRDLDKKSTRIKYRPFIKYKLLLYPRRDVRFDEVIQLRYKTFIKTLSNKSVVAE